jgi:hypothetical protein
MGKVSLIAAADPDALKNMVTVTPRTFVPIPTLTDPV